MSEEPWLYLFFKNLNVRQLEDSFKFFIKELFLNSSKWFYNKEVLNTTTLFFIIFCKFTF